MPHETKIHCCDILRQLALMEVREKNPDEWRNMLEAYLSENHYHMTQNARQCIASEIERLS